MPQQPTLIARTLRQLFLGASLEFHSLALCDGRRRQAVSHRPKLA